MRLKTGTGVEGQRDVRHLAAVWKTDERLGDTALQNKELGVLSAQGRSQRNAAGGVS